MTNSPKRTYWRITYLPSFEGAGECAWTFKGTEAELEQYLLDKHGCSCANCKGESWWDTARSCEYIVEEEKEDD